MRRTAALLLAVLCLPHSGGEAVAQIAFTATISGRALDARREPLEDERVELLFDNQVIDTRQSGSQGEFTFANLRPGEYLVRISRNCREVGTRVTLISGRVTAIEIVVPSVIRCAAIWFWPASLAAVAATAGVIVTGS